MAQQQTTTAAGSGTDGASQALRLLPIPATGSRVFWAVHAVNDGTLHQAFSRHLTEIWASSEDPLLKESVVAAWAALHNEAHKSFGEAKKAGVLLFAWHGSSALEGGAA